MGYYETGGSGGYGLPPRGRPGGYLPPTPFTPQPPAALRFPSLAAAQGAASAAAPSAPPSQGSSGPAMPDLSHLDYSNDPILARIRALAQQSISDANAEALRQREQLAIGYGDADFARSLGVKGKFVDEAKNNPFSTVHELARAYQRRNVFDINRPLSDQANLFYSSERGRQLGLSGEQNLRDQSTARNAVQERSASISQQILQAKLAAQQQIIAGEQEAYQRALQMALYSVGAGG